MKCTYVDVMYDMEIESRPTYTQVEKSNYQRRAKSRFFSNANEATGQSGGTFKNLN